MDALRQVSSQMTLTPAWGKRLTSKAELQAGWDAGKDFRIYPWGGYTSIRDLPRLRSESSSITLLCMYDVSIWIKVD